MKILLRFPEEADFFFKLGLAGDAVFRQGHDLQAARADLVPALLASRGATGFWVEGGRIAYPVHEVTVAGNLKDIYLAIVDVGSDVDIRGGIRTGSILIEQMTIAGD